MHLCSWRQRWDTDGLRLPIITKTYINALCIALRRRVELLAEIVNSRTRLFSVDDVRSDVTENIAYSGKDDGDEDIESKTW